MRVDLATGELGGSAERLTGRERALLAYLAARPFRVVSQDTLLTEVWGYRPGVQSRAVAKTLNRLRAKIEPEPSQPRWLHTVHGEGVRFTPPAAPTPAHDLPAEVDRFVGRAAERDAVASLLTGGARLVSLVGPPGVGKTRLAREIARAHAGPGRHVRRCGLVDSVSGHDVLRAVFDALDAGTSSGDGATRRLEAVLADRGPLLLLLDDADRARDALRPLVLGWLEQAPALVVLATCRQRLGVRGERVVDLAGLPDADAAALLSDRAGWGPEADDAAQRLARRLEGLPLALELVAAHAATLSPALLVERTDWALRRPSPHAADPRHATLDAAVRWSWELLPPRLQRALVQLTVFRGPFSLDSAEHVLDVDDPGGATVALRERSLLWLRDDRFGLYDAVRDYAEPQRTGRVARKVGLAHARWCAALARELLHQHGRIAAGPHLKRAIGVADLQAACTFAAGTDGTLALELASLAQELLRFDLPREVLVAHLDAALAAAPDAPEHLRWFARCRRGKLLLNAGQAEGRSELEAVLAAATRLGDRALEARALLTLSQRDLPGRDRVADARRALTLVDDTSPVEQAYTRFILGFVLRSRGLADAARVELTLAEQAFADLGQAVPRLRAQSELLPLRRTPAELDAGIAAIEAALLDGDLPPMLRASCAFPVATALLDRGRVTEAMFWCRIAHRLFTELGFTLNAVLVQANLGLALLDLGHLDAAEAHFRRTLEQLVRFPEYRPQVRGDLGVVRAFTGDLDGAAAALDDALEALPLQHPVRGWVLTWRTAVALAQPWSPRREALLAQPAPTAAGRGAVALPALWRAFLGIASGHPRALSDAANDAVLVRAMRMSHNVRSVWRFLHGHVRSAHAHTAHPGPHRNTSV